MDKRVLNDQQKLFLELLFQEGVDGDAVKAKKAAGYADTYPTSQIVKALQNEIVEATRLYLSRLGPKAAIKLGSSLDNPSQLGVQFMQAAAKDILDRIGVVKTEKIELGGSGIFILPPKEIDNG